MSDPVEGVVQPTSLSIIEIEMLILDALKTGRKFEFQLIGPVPQSTVTFLLQNHGRLFRVDGDGLRTLQGLEGANPVVLNRYNDVFTIFVRERCAAVLAMHVKPCVAWVRLARDE